VKSIACVCAGVACAVVCGFAQGVSIPTVGIDNMHILSADPARAREWYIKYMGATAAPAAGQAYLGATKLVFLKNEKAQPSAGSTIDHLGLSVADVDAKMKELEAGGARAITSSKEMPGLFAGRFVQDPWGVKIEVLKDPEALGLHHVHLRVRDPEATLVWFQKMMGGERVKSARLNGLRYASLWLLAADSDRAIQHIAWRVPNITEARTTLIGRGLKVGDSRPSQGVPGFAFLEDPSGVRIEIIQREQP
jgi:catechol 2,3-dioxygenase-like lactoylglutathione lyase family enzyme/predicted enzyme related to lactoylglutathione lyase